MKYPGSKKFKKDIDIEKKIKKVSHYTDHNFRAFFYSFQQQSPRIVEKEGRKEGRRKFLLV